MFIVVCRMHELAIGRNYVDCGHMSACRPVSMIVEGDTALEQEPTDRNIRAVARREPQRALPESQVQVGPPEARLGRAGARGGIDDVIRHPVHVHQQRPITQVVGMPAVAPGADAQLEVLLTRQPHRRDHVIVVSAIHDGFGITIRHAHAPCGRSPDVLITGTAPSIEASQEHLHWLRNNSPGTPS